MEMNVHLHPDVFEIVKLGIKDIEVRVNDERPLEDESIRAKVVGLEYYDNFSQLVNCYDMKRIYLEGYTKENYLKEMSRFYTEEEQKEFGVVAIIFEKE